MSLLLEALKRAEQEKQKNVLSERPYEEEADSFQPPAAPKAAPSLPPERVEETAFPTLELAEPIAEIAPPASTFAAPQAVAALSLETLSLEPHQIPALLEPQADEMPAPSPKTEPEEKSPATPPGPRPREVWPGGSPSGTVAGGNHPPLSTSEDKPLAIASLESSPAKRETYAPPATASAAPTVETPPLVTEARRKQTRPPIVSAAPTIETPRSDQSTANSSRQRQAANVLIATKPSPRRRTLLLSMAGAAVFIMLGGGGYVYWQLAQTAPPLGIALNPPPAKSPEGKPPATSPEDKPPAKSPEERPPQAPIAGLPAEPLAAAPSVIPPDAPPSPNKEAAFSIRHSQRSATVDPTLTRAYTAFMAGDLKAAKQDYSASLRQDANNPDALLGMAAIASKNGRREEAIQTYRRLLELDPRNPSAQAGLLSLTADRADSVQSESRIKTLLSQQPDSHFLYFTLGNLYVGQSRWAEAQQAFFHAYSKAPDNPDYLYNLAVSLDHLGQRPTALKFYRQALAASPGHPANFDLKLLQTRIQQLTASGASPGASP